MPKLTCPIAFLFLLWPFCSLKAQETTSEIAGVVMDEKSTLTGSIIKAVHLPTGTNYVTTSRRDGRYNLTNLKIGGPYTVTVSFIGYKEEKKENIMLLVGQEYKADFVLVSQSKELAAVTVQNLKQGKVFNNNHTGPQEIITREHLETLPTLHRSIEDFSTLMPSAYNLNFGGRNAVYNNLTLDGANFSNVFGLVNDKRAFVAGQPISIEAIEQIQINIAPYDVRLGGFAGTNLNMVSRSGTNNFRGSAYLYLNGPGTTGYKVGNEELPKETFSYNRPGFTVSGPIIKDKVFFFINAERENFTTPSSAFKAADALHDPDPDGTISAAHADTLNRLRHFLIDKFSYDPGAFQGYNLRTKKDRLSVKIDWNIDTNSTFSVKYNFFDAAKDDLVSNSLAPRGYRQPGTTGLPFSGTGFTNFSSINSFIAELNSNWRGIAANKLQVGYLSVRNYRKSLGGQIFPFVDIMNGQQRQSYTAFGFEPLSYHNHVDIDILQVADNFTLYKGLHEINFGTQSFIKRYKSGFAPYYQGVYRFNTLADFYASVNEGRPNAVSYVLQFALTKDGKIPDAEVSLNELGFFVQDKLRFKNKLILTYGLRLDLPVFDHTFTQNEYVKALAFRDGKHYDIGEKPSANILVSPRMSFNWDLSKKVKTQIRGGAGLFAGAPPLIWLSNAASNGATLFGTWLTKGISFSPDINAYRPVYDGGEYIDTSYELAMIPKGFKYPQVLKANIAFDRLLPGNIIASLEATYSKDIVAVFFQNVNLPNSNKTLSGIDNRVLFDSTQINSGSPFATAENPNIENAILMNNTKKGFAYSIGLQLQKRVNDFYFGAAYTYSKVKSVNDGGALQVNMWSNRPVTGDPNSEDLGFADFYQPHRFIAYGSYRKEYAKYFATSVSFIFEAGPSGTGSYTYYGDVNNDGALNNNDLMYIPRDKSEIVLVPVYTGWTLPVTDTRTPDQIWAQLDNFIRQDAYLSSHRGKYAQRNAVVLPFFKRLDLNISQDISFFKGRHTIRLSFDLINVGNFLNKNWGTYKTFSIANSYVPLISSILQYEGLAPDGKPQFSFPYLDPINEIPLTKSFTDEISIYSRWQGQFGIRYLFQ